MPGPNGTLEAQQTINKPQVASSRRGIDDNTGHHQFQFEGTATGAATGASFGGGYGAAIGAGIGLVGDSVNYFLNRKSQREQQKIANQNAATQYARQRELLKETERYNSVQNQVDMLRQAGLNPALAYGSLSSASVSTPSAVAAESVPPSAADFGSASASAADVSSALLSGVQQASSAQDVVTKQITNRYLDTRSIAELQRINSEIQKDLADASLSDEQRENLQSLRDTNIKLMLAQAESHLANAQKSIADKEYVEGAATDLAAANAFNAREQGKTQSSVRALNTAKTKTESTQQDLNISKIATEESQQDLNFAKVTTEETIQNLNRATHALTNVKTKDLSLQLKLSSKEVSMLEKFVKDHDLPSGSVKPLMLAFDEFSKGTGKGLSEFLSGTNWMRSITELVKIFKWDKSQDDDFSKIPRKSDNNTSSNPPVTQPNGNHNSNHNPNPVSDFEKHLKGIYDKCDKTQRDEINKFHRETYPKLSEIDKYNYRLQLLNCQNPEQLLKLQEKYYYNFNR